MPRWDSVQARPATFRSKVSAMSKLSGDGPSGQVQPNPVPDAKPPQGVAAPDQPKPKRRPSKTRQQAWAKIDGGRGTWKPK
jgi:hypothetical protein